MEKRSWSARVVVRYALLQLPFTALMVVALILVRKWVNLPVEFIWALLALLVIKDIALFPLVWRSYDPDSPALTNSMEGARGIAVEDLHPSGYIEIRAELWKAEVMGGGPPIRRGESVRVCRIRGLTLLVQTDRED
jgi:membrane-bound ClpP family serine protease